MEIYDLKAIEKVIHQQEYSFAGALIQGIEEGFLALERGEFFAAPIQTMGLKPFPFKGVVACNDSAKDYAAQTCVKSGYFVGQNTYVIKVASGGYPLPSNSGLLQIYSQRTGQLEALLLDNGILTEWRTAAIGALAAKHWMPSSPADDGWIGILGTGIQARYQCQMLQHVTNCRNILIWGRNPAKATALQTDLVSQGWNVRIASTPSQLLQECFWIVTTTSAREPVLQLNNMELPRRNKLFIVCIGSDAPGKQELDPALLEQADLLIADKVDQSLERGEFQHLKGDRKKIVSLGTALNQPDLVNKSSHAGLVVLDSSGVALQDCVVAEQTWKLLKQQKECCA